MILKQGHKYEPMPHDGKLIAYIYRGGRCYYHDGPYSLAATQALRAAFPQYWTAIRDYGYAHPQLVPFINEDPMLIVSLVEVGKTRWLVGDGKAFIRSGVIANANSGVELTFRTFTSENKSTGLLTVDKAANSQAFGVSRWDGLFVCWYGSQASESRSIAMNVGVTYYYKQNRGSIEITSSNGESAVKNFTLGSSSIFAGEFCYPATCRNGNVPTTGGLYESPMVKIYDNDQLVRHFVPCQHQGEAGMLDVVTATFHPNANTQGTFTIAITDKP